MELKDFQQEVLDTFDGYLDTLVEQRLRTAKTEKLSLKNPELNLQVPDYTEETWNTLKKLGKLPKARVNVPFSTRKDGMACPGAFGHFQNSHRGWKNHSGRFSGFPNYEQMGAA